MYLYVLFLKKTMLILFDNFLCSNVRNAHNTIVVTCFYLQWVTKTHSNPALSHTYQPSVSLRGMCLRGAWEQMCSVMCPDILQDIIVTHCKKIKCDNNSIVFHFFIFVCVIWWVFLLVAFCQPTKKANQIKLCTFCELCVLVVFWGVLFYTFFEIFYTFIFCEIFWSIKNLKIIFNNFFWIVHFEKTPVF